jgi:hypothetical protein
MSWVEIKTIPDSTFEKARLLRPLVMALTDGTFETLSPVSGNTYHEALDDADFPLRIYCDCASPIYCFHDAAVIDLQVLLLEEHRYLHTHFCPLCEREYFHAERECETGLMTCEACFGAVCDASEPLTMPRSMRRKVEELFQ